MDFKNDPKFIELYSKLTSDVCKFWDGKGKATDVQLQENIESVARSIKALCLYLEIDYMELLKKEVDLTGNLSIDVMRLYIAKDNKERAVYLHKLISILTLLYSKFGKNIEDVK